MASMSQVVSVFPSKKRELQTTESWNFIGFPETSKRATYESDVIVGMLDTRIWPETESFNDEGLGPPPSKWKGSCQALPCNNKIIGAKYYNLENVPTEKYSNSPRDSNGHGSHTSSIAAGRVVPGMSLYDLAKGRGRGGVPSTKLVVYKVCWSSGCHDSDILAAFDDAIADGVEILSVSLGGTNQFDYFWNSIAIGAFHAMKNGILTSTSAGNSGPRFYTLSNYSPWSLTVAANTIDRRFVANVRLGNGRTYEGAAINTFDMSGKMYPLVYGGDAPAAGYDSSTSRYCYQGSLNPAIVKGRIVLCNKLTNSTAGPLLSGAVGLIIRLEDSAKLPDDPISFPLPTTVVNMYDGADISRYISTTSNPTATIQKSQVVSDPAAPYVASFSSKGPNPITADILKVIKLHNK